MSSAVKIIKELKCFRCGGKWFPKSPDKPKFCAKCNSPYWDRPRRKLKK